MVELMASVHSTVRIPPDRIDTMPSKFEFHRQFISILIGGPWGSVRDLTEANRPVRDKMEQQVKYAEDRIYNTSQRRIGRG